MDVRLPQPHQNGVYETPHAARGVSAALPPRPRPQTVFAPDAPLRGTDAIAYALHHFIAGGLRVGQWVTVALTLLIGLWATGLLPGRWWGVVAWAGVLVGYQVWGWRRRAARYVRFTPAPAPPPARPLGSSEKLPVYASGALSVEGKQASFTWAPGFYRTFATGEHAILCQVRARRWGLAVWPEEQIGMWYAFVAPHAITALHWGDLTFGRTQRPAIAIHYTLSLPPTGRRTTPQLRAEVLYLAVTDPADGCRIYHDLAHSLPASPPPSRAG